MAFNCEYSGRFSVNLDFLIIKKKKPPGWQYINARKTLGYDICVKCCCSNRRWQTDHNQMTSPSNTRSATLTLNNTWVKYLCFECVWIVLNESLMESRFKPEMNCLAFSLYHSGISAGSKRGREPTHTRSGEKPSPSLTSEVAESQRPCSNKHTQNSLFCLLKSSCLSAPGQGEHSKDKYWVYTEL